MIDDDDDDDSNDSNNNGRTPVYMHRKKHDQSIFWQQSIDKWTTF